MTRPPLLIGVDLGTNSLRINVYSLKGKILDSAQGSYPIYKPRPMWVEQNPEDWWQAFCKSIFEIYHRGKIDLKQVAVIGVAGQTNGHVLLDDTGELLDRSIIWMDRRANEEAEWLQQTFSSEDRVRYLGVNLPLDSTTIPARILWLKKNKPKVMAKAKVTLQPKDYINFRLTGKLATDVVSCKTIINFRTQKLEPEYFSRANIPIEIFPTIYQPTSIIGVTNGLTELGIPNGIPVIAGTIDAWANILGSGVVNPGQAAEVSGTSEVLSVVSEKLVISDKFNVVPSFDHVILNGPTQSGGGSLDWFADIVQGDTSRESISRKELLDKWHKDLDQIPAGSNGVIFLPYLQGERTPIWDSKARGGFIGLNSSHNQLCLVRSILEGVAFNMRHVLDTIEELGEICVESICISGGGSKNDFWNQIKADVTGKKLIRPLVLDTTSLGAAMFGGIGVGIYSNYSHAAESAVSYSKQYLPMSKNHDVYENSYKIYRELYPRLKDLFPLMG